MKPPQASTQTQVVDDPWPRALRATVFLLCLVSGSVDALCFLALGDAFASVMTGNVVFVGIALGTANAHLIVFCGTAIVVYGATCFAVGRTILSRDPHRTRLTWSNGVTRCLHLEAAILVIVALLWAIAWSDPTTVEQLILLACCSIAMGSQSMAVRSLGIRVSTTYMTGAYTTLIEAISLRRRLRLTEHAAWIGLGGLACGALLSASTLKLLHVGAFAPTIVALAAALAIVRGRTSDWNRREAR